MIKRSITFRVEFGFFGGLFFVFSLNCRKEKVFRKSFPFLIFIFIFIFILISIFISFTFEKMGDSSAPSAPSTPSPPSLTKCELEVLQNALPLFEKREEEERGGKKRERKVEKWEMRRLGEDLGFLGVTYLVDFWAQEEEEREEKEKEEKEREKRERKEKEKRKVVLKRVVGKEHPAFHFVLKNSLHFRECSFYSLLSSLSRLGNFLFIFYFY